MNFSTKDSDNDKDTRFCAVQFSGAWWPGTTNVTTRI